ncbi:hypothetical protein [Plebeiibacterium marinum]|uniref:Uncharacterized protein n=1 Tax=Plebeiibacterium marinum TaxID=2992111 RepID=A0AAE3SJW6_9BACT|nr:hypothetical protein [Plebeiobacterium marinum]MCW3806002.1 hypothetical protein [Plebeiobacterium marinum]
MARSKKDDTLIFKCGETHKINYFTHLYGKDEEVKRFLKRNCALGTIENKTHLELFQLIERELGIPQP